MPTIHYSDGREEVTDDSGKVVWRWPEDRLVPVPGTAGAKPEPEPVKSASKKAAAKKAPAKKSAAKKSTAKKKG